ncbi:DUF1772 domain-containing protein [Grimontia sp. SpTr1]|uniref:DUF1772 domain-containing protein n=1 Tax=Grimontia sp. SpTr1 TaxID=2995319 RepID=UPI00248CEAF2|nr:DUF1772 domain-containing protein [Grimontia sp. SpTr1]
MNKVLGVSSTILLGLMAGFFATYSFNVNMAMLEVDGETYASVQPLFNQNVRHTAFFVCFFGAGLLPLVTGVYWFKEKQTMISLGWLLIALTYILGIIVFTRFVNLPLNYYTESWDPSLLPTDWEVVREEWNRANFFRSIVSIVVFIGALLLREFVTSDGRAR